jgi:hypothetical protein
MPTAQPPRPAWAPGVKMQNSNPIPRTDAIRKRLISFSPIQRNLFLNQLNVMNPISESEFQKNSRAGDYGNWANIIKTKQ